MFYQNCAKESSNDAAFCQNCGTKFIRSNENSIKWYYEENGSKSLALSELELINKIKLGDLTFGSHIWTEGMPNWQSLENTAFVKYLSRDIPPPIDENRVDNSIIIFMSWMPLISMVVQSIWSTIRVNENRFGSSINSVILEFNSNGTTFIIISMVVYTFLGYLDSRILKSAGHKHVNLGYLFFIPVYIYKRSKALNQNHAHLITWVLNCAILVFFPTEILIFIYKNFIPLLK